MSSQHPVSKTQLLRVLGPVGATAVVAGSVIGSGIFFKANVIAQAVGRFDLVLLVWVVCGAMSLLGALAAAELGAMMPRAGGQYVYLRESYGPLSGFLWGWGEFWMMRTGSIAALAVAFAHGFYQATGAWMHNAGWLTVTQVGSVKYEVLFGAVTVSQQWVLRGIAIASILLLSAVNTVGARWGGLMQIATTVVKAATLAGLMVLPFLTGTMEWGNLSTRFQRPGEIGLLAGFGAAMTAAFWAYDGWGNIGPVAEEVKDPRRNLPLSLFVGIFISIALYLGVTVAYHLVLTTQEIADSPFVAASAFERMLGHRGAAIASAAVMVSAFGALNSNLLVGPRVIFAMARDRLFLAPMARIHRRYRTPHVAIFAETVWSCLLIVGSDLLRHVQAPTWIYALPKAAAEPIAKSIEGMAGKAIFDVLTDYVIFGQLVFYLLAVGSVFVLRIKRPDWRRPYKTLGYPVLPAIFMLGSAWFLIGMFLTSPVESILGAVFLGSGAVAYAFRPRHSQIPEKK